MGALEGSLSFKTFYVQGEPPDDFHEGYLQRLQKHFFEPLTPAGEDERSVGWVPVQDPISEGFSRDQVFFNQYIVFAMRIDKWALPAPWVKAMTRKAIQERLPQIEAEEAEKHREDGKLQQPAKLSKREKEKIKLEVVTEIKNKILPAMKIIDVVWNIQECTVRFWSTSNALCDEFAELFEDTFGLSLKANSPYMMAEQLGMTEKQLDSMVDADPWHPVFENE
ncbi:MAG: recombination-associated protein RdgC [Proteobacteria bacterium]|nr:recombination-associated protein RdgC [Pseudomonadota bacterium]